MHVKLIDLNVRVLDMEPAPIYREATFKGLGAMPICEGATPLVNPVNVKTYKIRSIHRGHLEQRIAIRDEDNKLLEDLMLIKQGEIDDRVYMAERAGRESGYVNCRASIKSLPWYKRLFNQF